MRLLKVHIVRAEFKLAKLTHKYQKMRRREIQVAVRDVAAQARASGDNEVLRDSTDLQQIVRELKLREKRDGDKLRKLSRDTKLLREEAKLTKERHRLSSSSDDPREIERLSFINNRLEYLRDRLGQIDP